MRLILMEILNKHQGNMFYSLEPALSTTNVVTGDSANDLSRDL